MARQTTLKRKYSTAFKLRVLEEVEAGMSISEARARFNIGGKMTINKWIQSLGNPNLAPRLQQEFMTSKENNEIELLKKEKAKLEAALLEKTIENICLESLVEATEEHYGIDLKKNFGVQAQKKLRKKRKRKR